MNENLPGNFTSLEQTELVSSLLPDAILLLEKDFTSSGIDIELSGKISGDVFDLRDLISQHILKTGGPGAEQFYRLLYRIDIPEAKIKSALASSSDCNFETVIAEMIIIRELQKAFYRKNFGR